jgi:EmrB/QacA subfamily drug resistance transporter
VDTVSLAHHHQVAVTPRNGRGREQQGYREGPYAFALPADPVAAAASTCGPYGHSLPQIIPSLRKSTHGSKVPPGKITPETDKLVWFLIFRYHKKKRTTFRKGISTVSAHAATADNDKLDPVIWRTAIAVIVGVFMSILDLTIVNVALEKLGNELNAGGFDEVQWVMTAYMLAVAAVIPISGWASERLGGKRLFLASLVTFTLASVLCAVSWNIWSLVGFRVLQGFAGGALMPTGQILLAKAAGPQRMGRIMGVIGVPMLLAPVLGPVVGGLILDSLPWEWIFLVNVPVGIIGFFLAKRMVPNDLVSEREQHARENPLDYVGLLLLTLGLPMIVYGLANIPGYGIDAIRSWGPIVVGVGLTAWFARHALRHVSPLLDVKLFRRPPYTLASLTFLSLGAFLFGSIVLLPLYFQVARGEDVLTTGLLMAPQGLGAALGIALTGKLTDRIGGGPITVVGLVILVASTIPFTQLGADTSYWVIGIAMFIRGIGFGSTMMPSMTAAYATLEHKDISHATPQLNMVRQIGGSIGTALLATILQAELLQRGFSTKGRGEGAADIQLPHKIAVTISSAFGTTFWWVVAGTAVSLVPAVFLARAERKARAQRAAAHLPLVEDEPAIALVE